MTHIVFLRGINVGGHRKIKMADLKEKLIEKNFQNVQTYIQSGNLVLDSTKNREEITSVINTMLKVDFDFDVPTLVLTSSEVESILNEAPFKNVAETKNLYFALLHNPPERTNHVRLDPDNYPNEEFVITDSCVYLNCKLGAGKAKLNNNIIEQKLKITATTRNLSTLQKMIALANRH